MKFDQRFLERIRMLRYPHLYNLESEMVKFIKMELIHEIRYKTGIQIHLKALNKISLPELLCPIFLMIGEKQADIANWLSVSRRSVATYEKRFRSKLQAKSRLEMLYKACLNGIYTIKRQPQCVGIKHITDKHNQYRILL